MSPRQKVLAVTDRTARDLDEILRLKRSGQLQRKPEPRRSLSDDSQPNPSRLVMLLEEMSRTTIGSALLMREQRSGYHLDIGVLGWPTDPTASFTLRVNGGDVAIPMNATADEFKAKVGLRTATVTGGAIERQVPGGTTLYTPMRWFVSFPDKASALSITAGARTDDSWAVTVEETLDVATTSSIVQVRQRLPTGWTTPLRAGALAEVYRGGGRYVVIGAEARFWYGPPPQTSTY